MEKRKVFCIGLSRTGTTSLCEALEILNYRTIHFSLPLFVNSDKISEEVSFNPKRKLNPYWNWRRNKELDAIQAKFDPDFLEKYDAFGDLPIPLLYKELDHKFPGSKFIYTYRSEEKWLKSMKWLFSEGAVIWKHGLIDDELKFATYGCNYYNENKLLHAYREYHKGVKSYFAHRPEDILFLNIDRTKINFDSICEFLNLPNPPQTFPKSNQSRDISKWQHLDYLLGRKIPFYGLIKQKLID